jgi:Family of unknown function (DUF6252)/Lipocalin-like domain
MKNIKFLTVFAILFVAFHFSSCTNEPIDPALAGQLVDPNTVVTQPNMGNFTAKIDGVTFDASQVSAIYSTTSLGNQLSISGATLDGKQISIQILNPAIATFPASTAASSLLFFQYQDVALGAAGIFSSFNATGGISVGSMTITNFSVTNKKVTGSFSFTGFNSASSSNFKQITNGVFTDILFVDNTTTTPTPTTIAGTYLLTTFNSSVATDMNNDGVSSNNLFSESTCYNNSLLVLNANNTFTQTSKGLDIVTTGTTQTTSCFVDPDDTGTWSVSGNVLTLTYPSPTPSEQLNISGNTLSATEPAGQVVGYVTPSTTPVYLTSNLSFVFTKQ